MMIPEQYLELALSKLLALHDPKRAREGATVAQITAAVQALSDQLASADEAFKAKQRAWLKEQLP